MELVKDILLFLLGLLGVFTETKSPQMQSLSSSTSSAVSMDSVLNIIPADTYITLLNREEEMQPTLGTLRNFIIISSDIPDIKKEYKGNYDAYVKLLKQNAGADDDTYIGSKRQMRYFSDDYELLKRRVVTIDSIQRRNQFVEDSIASRKKYLEDSIILRRKYERLVEDSLKREAYRARNNYDSVLFDAQGRPTVGFRNSDKYEYDSVGLLRRVYQRGALIHDYKYSHALVETLGFDNLSGDFSGVVSAGDDFLDVLFSGWSDYYIKTDIAQKIIYRYSSDVRVAADGEVTGQIISETHYSYYSGTKALKTTKRWKGKELLISNFFSNGSLEKEKVYTKNANGQYILRRSSTYDGARVTNEYYDFNGNFEYGNISIDWPVDNKLYYKAISRFAM